MPGDSNERETAVSYAISNLVSWPVALLFILGGAGGSFLGVRLAGRLASRGRALTLVFSSVVALVGPYVASKGILTFVR